MADLPAISSSPIAFSSGGQYFLVPLTAIYFDDTGAIKADRWPLYATHKTALDPMLSDLRAAGVLVAGPAVAQKPAFKAVAKTPGASGVVVTIDISNVAPNEEDPAASKADVKVTETDTYTGLAVDKLVETIGSAANGGKRPGLVFVSSAGPFALPKAGNYPMAAAAAGDPATVEVPKDAGGGTAFTLETREGGADALNVAIEIKDVDTAGNTFTLVATWSKTQNAVAVNGLAAAFAYVIDVTAPASGFLAPAEGRVSLAGGSDAIAIDPVKASAVILSK